MEKIIWESGNIYLSHAIKVWKAACHMSSEGFPEELLEVINVYLAECDTRKQNIHAHMDKLIKEARRRLVFRNSYLEGEYKIDPIVATFNVNENTFMYPDGLGVRLENKILTWDFPDLCGNLNINLYQNDIKKDLWEVRFSTTDDDPNHVIGDYSFKSIIRHARIALGGQGHEMVWV